MRESGFYFVVTKKKEKEFIVKGEVMIMQFDSKYENWSKIHKTDGSAYGTNIEPIRDKDLFYIFEDKINLPNIDFINFKIKINRKTIMGIGFNKEVVTYENVNL